MKLFLDCEFNGFGGSLISLALVDENGKAFYEALHCRTPVSWVKQYVMPRLNKIPISLDEFQKRLAKFLMNYNEIHVIADWPEDISLLLNVLIIRPGHHLPIPPLTLELWKLPAIGAFTESELPHNALYDAISLSINYYEWERGVQEGI